MTLLTFERLLNKVQLEKGLEYFENGCISELEERQTDKWSAIVSGSEDYHVKIKIKKGAIEKCSCDCPHDVDYCKHIISQKRRIQWVSVHIPLVAFSTVGFRRLYIRCA